MIDKHYLNSVGWQDPGSQNQYSAGHRTGCRKAERIRYAGTRSGYRGGHGRYVLDALEKHQDIESILLRDYSDLNVEKGRP